MLKPNGHLVLIDFGTAREATYTYLAKIGANYRVTVVRTDDYTPSEQINGQAVPSLIFLLWAERLFTYWQENPRWIFTMVLAMFCTGAVMPQGFRLYY